MKSLIGGAQNKSPIPYAPKQSALAPLFGAKNPQERYMQAMGSVGTLFAIVDGLSESISQVDWKLYRKSTTGNDQDRVEVHDHLALKIWNNPNQFYTQNEFIEATQQHFELTGESWWVLDRDPNLSFPLGMWPVRPDRMEVVPHPTEFIAGYVYTGPNNEKIPLDVDEVILVKRSNPLSSYRGLGAVQSIMEDIDSSRLSAEWVKAFFANSAEPGGIIEVEEGLDDEEFRTLQRRWNEQHQGVSRAHRVAILEIGKWRDRKYSMKDMEFAELRGVNREIIREAFRFPKPLLGTVDDVNRANSEAAEVSYARWLITPRLQRIQSTLNNRFLPLFGTAGQGLEFDFVDPVPRDVNIEQLDRNSKALSAKRLVEAGYDPVAVAEAMGLPPMPWSGIPGKSGRAEQEPGTGVEGEDNE